jgi:di/tricarboxylate transporter
MGSVWSLVGLVAAIVILLVLVFIAESAISAKISEIRHRAFEKELEDIIKETAQEYVDKALSDIIMGGEKDNDE